MRNEAFVSKLMGKDNNAAIQHITKLTKDEKGTRALMFLVADLAGRGVVNDNEREGNEEEMTENEVAINMGLISNQVKNKGKLSDQNHVIRFRETGRDRLKQWLVDAVDKMAFLTMSGISYRYNLNGSDAGAANPWTELSFASDVSAPSTGRHFYFNGTNLVAGDTTAVTTGCVPKYGMIVDLRAYAKASHMAPIRVGGKEYYKYICDPRTLARLKKDSDFLSAVTQAGKRGDENPFFSGGIVTIDGLVIMEHNLVYNTSGLASGSKWGVGSDVEGTRSLLLGCQALGMVDVGAPDWVEKGFDYDSKQGISIDKFIGFKKPTFDNPYTGNADEDFGVLCCDLTL
jgi:N4-gp56 family major capsid protein